MLIDEHFLNMVSAQAKASPRLRMNYNFHQSLEDKCHRMLNAVEPGTVVSIHWHPTKDESFVILRGKVRVTTHNDDGSIIEDVVLSQESGNYGVDIPDYSGINVPLVAVCNVPPVAQCNVPPQKWLQ